MDERVARALAGFEIPEGEMRAEPYGNGHINHTYHVTVGENGGQYILQEINAYVFHHPDQVQENIQAVTDHLRRKIAQEGGDPERETLRLIPCREGGFCLLDRGAGEEHWWRMFRFVEDTSSMDLPDSPAVFEKCGRAFGKFQRRLADFPAETLHETIPQFHHTPWRVEQLEEAARKDAKGRLRQVKEEMAFCMKQAEDAARLTDALAAGRLPLRVTHNDTKLNNVLLDRHTGEALCVVDLDTVMPGLTAYDYGEAIRTGASTAPEDERDLSRVDLSLPMVKAYTRGFLQEAGDQMTGAEIQSLPWGARLMTLENGLRFLADYLEGDVYYSIHRPEHNLDRARAQLALLRKMEEKWEDLQAAVEQGR